MDIEQLLHARPQLGLRDKMKELHPDTHSSFRTGQQKASMLPGKCGIGMTQVCQLAHERNKEKASPWSQEVGSS